MKFSKRMNGKFQHNPLPGHSIQAEIVEPENNITKAIDQLTEELSIEPQNRTRIQITESDVDWNSSNQVSMKLEAFHQLILWYEHQVGLASAIQDEIERIERDMAYMEDLGYWKAQDSLSKTKNRLEAIMEDITND